LDFGFEFMPHLFNSRQRAFTLIELLVVVFIVSLLAVLVLINIGTVRAKSRDSRRVADIKSIQEGLAMYNNNHQIYPIYDGYITGSDTMSNDLLNDGLMQSVPTDPLNRIMDGVDHRYHYQSVTGSTYLIEYNLETNSIQGKSQGLNTAAP